MRILAKPVALGVISEDYCVQIGRELYICGLDYMLVKGYVMISIADYVFGFIGDIPVLDIQCGKYLLYYGVLKTLFNAKHIIEGWRRAEAEDTIVVYNCIEDAMEFFEVEAFLFSKVPLNMFGFGSWEMYRLLMSLARSKNLYMLRYFY
jgi:hypothetical protein